MVRGIGLTQEDFKRLLACVAAATKAMHEQGEDKEAFELLMLGMKLTNFVELDEEDVEANGVSLADVLRMAATGDKECN